ncbi:hypothetical protein BC832DRAFT_615378 [Gaertneriomyces semiglobifer]|nr:hypothetical protein BC832DRAFT_615378 [Gaertneriomyces semiglobifer]
MTRKTLGGAGGLPSLDLDAFSRLAVLLAARDVDYLECDIELLRKYLSGKKTAFSGQYPVSVSRDYQYDTAWAAHLFKAELALAESNSKRKRPSLVPLNDPSTVNHVNEPLRQLEPKITVSANEQDLTSVGNAVAKAHDKGSGENRKGTSSILMPDLAQLLLAVPSAQWNLTPIVARLSKLIPQDPNDVSLLEYPDRYSPVDVAMYTVKTSDALCSFKALAGLMGVVRSLIKSKNKYFCRISTIQALTEAMRRKLPDFSTDGDGIGGLIRPDKLKVEADVYNERLKRDMEKHRQRLNDSLTLVWKPVRDVLRAMERLQASHDQLLEASLVQKKKAVHESTMNFEEFWRERTQEYTKKKGKTGKLNIDEESARKEVDGHFESFLQRMETAVNLHNADVLASTMRESQNGLKAFRDTTADIADTTAGVSLETALQPLTETLAVCNDWAPVPHSALIDDLKAIRELYYASSETLLGRMEKCGSKPFLKAVKNWENQFRAYQKAGDVDLSAKWAEVMEGVHNFLPAYLDPLFGNAETKDNDLVARHWEALSQDTQMSELADIRSNLTASVTSGVVGGLCQLGFFMWSILAAEAVHAVPTCLLIHRGHHELSVSPTKPEEALAGKEVGPANADATAQTEADAAGLVVVSKKSKKKKKKKAGSGSSSAVPPATEDEREIEPEDTEVTVNEASVQMLLGGEETSVPGSCATDAKLSDSGNAGLKDNVAASDSDLNVVPQSELESGTNVSTPSTAFVELTTPTPPSRNSADQTQVEYEWDQPPSKNERGAKVQNIGEIDLRKLCPDSTPLPPPYPSRKDPEQECARLRAENAMLRAHCEKWKTQYDNSLLTVGALQERVRKLEFDALESQRQVGNRAPVGIWPTPPGLGRHASSHGMGDHAGRPLVGEPSLNGHAPSPPAVAAFTANNPSMTPGGSRVSRTVEPPVKRPLRIRCGNCGAAGHESVSCQMECRYCGEHGHLSWECEKAV